MEIKIGDEIINMLSLVKLSSDKFHNKINQICPVDKNTKIYEENNKIKIHTEDQTIMEASVDKIAVIEKKENIYTWCWTPVEPDRQVIIEKIKDSLPEEYSEFKNKDIIYFDNPLIITAVESYIYDIGCYQHIISKRCEDDMYVIYCIYDAEWQMEEIKPVYSS
jgi:hypothetical protein